MIKRTKSLLILFNISMLLIFMGCRQSATNKTNDIAGDLVIFHAGSLSVPFKIMADSFELLHPNIKIKAESAGSLACIRKITDLNSPCDILASADYSLIDKLMIPNYALWNLHFAGNEMALVFRPESAKANEINADNWYEILLLPEIRFGRSDPNSDPCGYRTLLSLKLAEGFYNKPGLTGQFIRKDEIYIRPKEVDLLALLESGTIDYIFIYKSVAIQHKLAYLELPDSINLGNPDLGKLYSDVSVEIAGNKPGETITQKGEPMVYGITIPKTCQNQPAAEEFIRYLLSDGLKTMKKMGQKQVTPTVTGNPDLFPEGLKSMIK